MKLKGDQETNIFFDLFPEIKTRVIYSDQLFMFLSFDGTLIITTGLLDVCGQDDNALFLLISHELAHYLLDHQQTRIVNTILHKLKIKAGYYETREIGDESLRTEFNKRTFLQNWSCFYRK